MKIGIIIPIHNEANHLKIVLDSYVNQEEVPSKLIIVDDNSTDNSYAIIKSYADRYSWIKIIALKTSNKHLPGPKVINAFNKGLEDLTLDDYNLIGKFDGDICLPPNYFKQLINAFTDNPKLGMASGQLYIKKGKDWIFESISKPSKVRGPVKLYNVHCFQDIGGLKPYIGWDTADQLIAQFKGWDTITLKNLKVQHLKATGNTYEKRFGNLQGEAFYRLRYGWLLTIIASIKLAFRKGQIKFFLDYLIGYAQAKKNKVTFLVSEEEGRFIRKLRWKGIKKKIGLPL